MLRLSPNPMVVDELDHDDKKWAAVTRLTEEISKLKWASGSSEIKLLNGQYLLVINAIPNRRRGVFSVRVIKRGKCDIVLDPFLSPTIPVVEDLAFGN